MINVIISKITELLASNQFFSGGILLGIMGGMLVSLRRIPRVIANLIKRHIIVELEINNYDECFKWFIKWFTKNKYVEKSNLLMLSSRNKDDNDNNDRELYISPGIGIHRFWYKKCFFWLDRTRDVGSTYTPKKFESFNIKTFRFNKNKLLELIKEARDQYYDSSIDDTIGLYTVMYADWITGKRVKRRSIDSVILDDGIIEDLIEDIENFKANEKFYNDKSIPYRRGYLFHGPTGTGKTSSIIALANHFNANIYIINLGNKSINDNELLGLFNDVPKYDFVVIEDIDTASSAKREDSGENRGVTFSGLLNVIDGIGAQEGRILFMTTNFYNKIDLALIRSGRVDKTVKLDYASELQIKGMFNKFYIGTNGKEDRFVDTLKIIPKLSTANIQEILVRSNTAENAIKIAKTFNPLR